MSQRQELVALAHQPGANLADLCRRFGVSRKTAYKWIARRREGDQQLQDHSRRPQHSPQQCPAMLEQQVLAVRREHPVWCGRKIRRWLLDVHLPGVPAASTITRILHRHGRIDEQAWRKHAAFLRFEYPRPNDLWQMDYKGDFALAQGRCHPLCVLDDHSRYALGLFACSDQQAATVQQHLRTIFRRYGLPAGMLMDNGTPWGGSERPYSRLSLWLMRLGMRVLHGRPYHPQTQGKLERFNRTLLAEAIGQQVFADLAACQQRLDAWREVYNLQRPHEALDLAMPVSRYQPSGRVFPEVLPPIEYGPGDAVRQVGSGGTIPYAGRPWKLGTVFAGQPVAVRPTPIDGVFNVYFCLQRIAQIDLREETKR